jgi:hypothetical protein
VQKLATADIYEEVAEYRRISVKLKSGNQAWVYLAPDDHAGGTLQFDDRQRIMSARE